MGYLLGFLLFAAIQTLDILLFTILALRVEYKGDLWQIFVLLMVLTVVAVNMGIFISTSARNEFQVVQYIPILFAPQVFLSGVIIPVDNMPGYFQAIAQVLPLRYAVDGLRGIMLSGETLADVALELGVLADFLVLAFLTVRRS